ncbi:ABC transporter ATP-binding protein [Phycicoccus sp. CSK15P-2]|uniref:ABC transporter ATP-binding protein n=1 Tax=Phycicoccus sp. CSK15P-2 TaxID=2807627 RepID=UPI0019528518|nr:ABC transporter ATP-binding protein [Phycicoccus sp. CSK15P-2]MBM6404940.1 ABC transporter ATP-binding protein [Phycicoccus sp. CSK15P-2]
MTPEHSPPPEHTRGRPGAAAVVTADGLVKRYGLTTALAGASLAVRPGDSVAIMGASGSGKTTLLHCLAGIATPDEGVVHYGGPDGDVEVTALSDARRSALRRSQFGFVFQEGLLVPELTAVENVALALMVGGTARGEAERLAAGWLAHLGLAGMEQRRIGQLSGGQAQRVAIARALVTGAPLIFADEPTGALDSHTSADVMGALLGATTATGRTLVLVTHDATVAARCARTVHMVDGVVAADRSASPSPSPYTQPSAPPTVSPSAPPTAPPTTSQSGREDGR